MTISNNLPDASQWKWAFTTRRVVREEAVGLLPATETAVAGDLVLCAVRSIGQHRKLQLTSRRTTELYVGDHIVVCLGDRYAPDQFEGKAKLEASSADLLAGGGIVGRMEHAHAKMQAPTQLEPLGVLADSAGKPMNIAQYRLPPRTVPDHVTVIGVFGASMNAGKTTAAVSLAHGLMKAGRKVFGIKATGTGAFADMNAFEDAGVTAMDFTDAGMPTTYRMPLAQIEEGFSTLVGHAAERGADIVVVEIADGVFQRETRAILRGSSIRDRLDGILFAAPDALGSLGGVEVLRAHGLAPFAISGLVTCSPLGQAEAFEATGIPHHSRLELASADIAHSLTADLRRTANRKAA
jgi:hypothetical protein